MSYGLADIVQQRRMIDESVRRRRLQARVVRKLDALVGLAETAGWPPRPAARLFRRGERALRQLRQTA